MKLMSMIQKASPSFVDRQTYVWWRATFTDAATPDMQITIEFMAPKEGADQDELKRAAVSKFNEMLEAKSIKIKFIEPVETYES